MKNRSLAISLSFAITLHSALAAAIAQPPSKSPLFNADTVVQLEMAADFVKIRKAAPDGGFNLEDGELNDPQYYGAIALRDSSHPERAFTGQARGRGMSSLYFDESEFPKLKVEIQDSEDLKGTLFQGARNFRVNTHLFTNSEGEHTPMGRLIGDNGPMREGLAYRLAEALGLKTPATRLARIRYTDYGTKTSFTRNALLVETTKKIGERLGGTEVLEYEFAEMEKTGIDPVEGALYRLFHKIIGNADIQLRVNEAPFMTTENRRAIFNAMVFEMPDKRRVPVIYDLDMSSFVTGYGEIKFTRKEFNLNTREAALFVIGFGSLRQKFTKEQLDKAIAIAKSKKDLLYQVVQNTPVDKAGRENAKLHLDTFFAYIDHAMSLPIIIQEGVQFYSDAQKKNAILPLSPMSEEPGTLRPGTPVAILGKEGKMLKVAILNINNDLPSYDKYIGYIDANTKIDTVLPSELVGRADERDMSFGAHGG
ncbi:hypothetical protein [Bdellovibrio sp. HCB337]|uniref:hypothetical protein n=1 Tax=Bdellovibrio sp. HCB337 TaxID=3394358 RepID=UPI0039A54A40